MRTILLATANPHKVEELRALLASVEGVRFVGLDEVGVETREPEEIGITFEENASIKALSYAEQTGLPALADDSGLEVDALRGRPGVISSHYCTDGRDEGMSREERDRGNNARLLRELEGVPAELRGARFVCVMALGRLGTSPRIHGSLPPVISRGTFEGRIGTPPNVPRGIHGFGYDPLFLAGPDFVQTGAELTPDVKNRRSHRAAAAAGMAARLAQLLRGPDAAASGL